MQAVTHSPLIPETDLLIVEDGPDDYELYQRLLGKTVDCKYVFTVASTGPDALAKLNLSCFDCVMLDYSLPGADGLALLKEFRASDSFLPIIMLTGQSRDDVAVAALKAGANDYIEKSRIRMTPLHEVIQKAIAGCRQAREAESLTLRPILVIDDNEDDREYYRRLLKKT